MIITSLIILLLHLSTNLPYTPTTRTQLYTNAKGEEGDEGEDEEKEAAASRLLTRQSVLRGAEEAKC